MSKLEGKIALIAGGNSGIGLATAKHFVDEGAYVFINGRRDVELLTAAKDIDKNVKALKGDVRIAGWLSQEPRSSRTTSHPRLLQQNRPIGDIPCLRIMPL
jgi:NAD(P)-dependent dehydrogenase (short-subunit alcohol dehydrogenase family)